MKTPPPYLGELEQLVLLAVLQCGEDAYTVPIRHILLERSKRNISRGALHTSLDRLEEKGFLTSKLGESLAIRGGRARRYFVVTTSGLDALRSARRAVTTLSRGLESMLEPRR